MSGNILSIEAETVTPEYIESASGRLIKTGFQVENVKESGGSEPFIFTGATFFDNYFVYRNSSEDLSCTATGGILTCPDTFLLERGVPKWFYFWYETKAATEEEEFCDMVLEFEIEVESQGNTDLVLMDNALTAYAASLCPDPVIVATESGTYLDVTADVVNAESLDATWTLGIILIFGLVLTFMLFTILWTGAKAIFLRLKRWLF